MPDTVQDAAPRRTGLRTFLHAPFDNLGERATAALTIFLIASIAILILVLVAAG